MRSSPPSISSNTFDHIHRCIPLRWWSALPSPLTISQAPALPAEALPWAARSSQLRSIVAFIQSASAVGHLFEAFAAFSDLRLRSPDAALLLRPLSSLLSCCTSRSAIPEGRQLHALVLALGFLDHDFLLPRLTSFYAAGGLLSDATSLAESSSKNRSFAWNFLVSAHARCRRWKGAIFSYKQMVERGVRVGKHAYSSVLRACGEMGDLVLGREIHVCMDAAGIELDLCAWNSLVAMYAKCGALDAARRLFDGMPERDVITWNSMISAYASVGRWEEAFELLELMPEGPGVNTVTWNAIVSGNLQLGNHWEVLRLISRMRISGPAVDYVTLVIGLKACSKVESVRIGKEIHGVAIEFTVTGLKIFMDELLCYITKQGFEDHLVLGNSLIGYGMQGEGITSLKLFQQMISSEIEPDHVTMVAILSACSHSGLVTEGQLLFDHMISVYGIAPRLEHFSCIVDLYCRAGLLKKAEDLINQMPFEPSIAMLATLVGASQVRGNKEIGRRAAKKLLEMKWGNPSHHMIHVHVDGTEIPENMLNLMRNKASNHVGWTRIKLRYYRLSALASFNGYQMPYYKAVLQGLQLHALTLSCGLHDHPSLLPRLTSLYITFGLLPDAHTLVFSSHSLEVLHWNLLISAYMKDDRPSDALLAYRQLVQTGIQPDRFTYPSVFKACGDVLDLEFGKEVHRSINDSCMEWNIFVQNALIAMYAKCGALGFARKLFDEMPERDVVSWNTMVSGYASRGIWEKAFQLFEQMRAVGSEVNSVTWNTIVGGHLQRGNPREALRLISEVTTHGSGVDFVTLVVGLSACSHVGSLKLGKEIHGFATRCCSDGIESVRNALITIPSRGSFFIIRDMVQSGVQPNYVTVVTYLALCARVANLQHGQELHCYITKHDFKGYLLLWNSLIDMYSKSGRILVARRVFDLLTNRDQVSYTSMIAGYGIQGEGTAALKLFYQMTDSGIKPDHINMVAVLSACSHSRLVSQGQKLFKMMIDSYGIAPQMEHYSCMVDLFARAGLVKKAEELLHKAPLPPTAAMWAALVGACQVYENTEIGERAAKKLLEMGTDNPGHYVLIANMYAAAGCWDELAKVRTLMRDLGVRKSPGLAWADLGNGFHPFLVGDRSNPLAPEIYEVLDTLTGQMSDPGSIENFDLGFVVDIEV
ncbi:PPR repeat [Musa troglodytarum]|uniref:PPR repeat n=1 Tax=Musa troglodytarum TaxID=320322 RepID=A0A9E7EL15_9LILI|nr:PPR repeat [Musa troglodytarum]